MPLYTRDHDAPLVAGTAKNWVDTCLVGDGSMLGHEAISNAKGFDALDRCFVQRPDAGDGSFYEKLETQMAAAPPEARKLMAEVLWSLFLFPSNIGAQTKREGVVRTWNWSGETLDPKHALLTEEVLGGIGSAGMGVNTNRWREVNYIIGLGQAIKTVPATARAAIFDDYDRFMAWLETVPQEGERQFRHMLRYFLFPERVERMSSNGDRIRVLAGFDVATKRALRKLSDRELDEALVTLRQGLEQKYGTKELDFYLPPLRGQWKKENEPDEPVDNDDTDGEAPGRVGESDSDYGVASVAPRNLILYGPPGTGKTWRLKKLFDKYTDQPADLDRPTWEQQLVARFGWRAVIAAALAQIGQPSRAVDVSGHALVKAKALQRRRKSHIAATMWSYMQEHTSPDVATVNVATRRPPFVFTKNDASEWSLVDDWRDDDPEAAELLAAWRAGPDSQVQPAQRYRVVTFHPSYAYEDFVVGLRPVLVDAADGQSSTGFRMVDGVFKQLCADARANPAKRYALFIDEINRANISKVFGELITLLEPDKRARYDKNGVLIGGMEVQLPGTGAEEGDEERFGVPENLDVYGTMNTADRSIALLDIALRRRFEFEEVPPDYSLLDRRIEGVHLGSLLNVINDRLEYLADRDRLVGHAYFTRVSTLEDLRQVFLRQLIPLLQEYFFDDFGRVELVLSNSSGKSSFIRQSTLLGSQLFGPTSGEAGVDREKYDVSDPRGWKIADFIGLYEGAGYVGVAEG